MPRILRYGSLLALLAVTALPVEAQTRAGSRAVETGSDGAQVFLHALSRISLHHASALGDSALWEKAIEGLIEQLDDPYATVFTPDEFGQFTETNTGNYAGIGVQISRLGSRVTVTAVFRDTPADGVGMLVGDRIVWVEGTDARDWTIDQARDSIRGEPGSVVNIRVARDGYAEPIPLTIVRDNVHVSAVLAAWADDGVAHFRIDRIARGVAEELEAALQEYADAHAVIIDLRGNPGGYLDESLRVADLLLAPGQALLSADTRGPGGEVEEQTWRARSEARLSDTPIIVLVDAFTASAAEIISGALQDHDRAIVIGDRTFGKGVVQTVYPLPAGRQLRITTGSWYTPLGRSLHRARNSDGTPRAEDEETGWVETAAGRRLQTGGGVFPDVPVVREPPRPEEIALMNHAVEAAVPIGVMVQEYALDLAKDALRTGSVVRLPSSAFDGLAAKLVEAGMDEEIVGNQVARAYLDQWTQLRYLHRADARELGLAVAAEEDPALAEALRLARLARSPAQLFALVDQAVSRRPDR